MAMQMQIFIVRVLTICTMSDEMKQAAESLHGCIAIQHIKIAQLSHISGLA